KADGGDARADKPADKADRGDKAPKADRGDKGDKGAKGDKAKGDKGDKREPEDFPAEKVYREPIIAWLASVMGLLIIAGGIFLALLVVILMMT
ncbi:MAG: hypothetical protein ABMB14_15175, partial [Myxococcota bacterium]